MARFAAAILGVVLAAGCPATVSIDLPGVDCDSSPDFSACLTDSGEGGACLLGTCVPHEPCPADGCDLGPSFPIPDTLLAECYDPEGAIPCPDEVGTAACADTPRCGQDAQYGWDTTHSRSERFSVADPGGEAVVTDAVTGLEWLGCVRGQGAGCEGEAQRGPWEEARTWCEESSWGGHDDWVMPGVYALHTLVDYSTTSPAVDTGVFQNTPSLVAEDEQEWWKECVWSSTDHADDPESAWGVMVNSGDVLTGSGVPFHGHDKAAAEWEGCYARCVRESAPREHERFVLLDRSGERVVADVVAARFWQGCSAGQAGDDCAGDAEMLPWADALARCEGLSWGGWDDWRLPNMMELGSLPDRGRASPAIDEWLFPNTAHYQGASDLEGQYWSSTARWYQGFALYVSFTDGGSHFYVQEEGRHVRCVRGGAP